jgi:hypothetical protein
MLGHVRVVGIIKLSFLSILERSDCIATPKENSMSDQCANLREISTQWCMLEVENSLQH